VNSLNPMAQWRVSVATPPGSLQRLLRKRDQRRRPLLWLKSEWLALPAIIILALMWTWQQPSPRQHTKSNVESPFSSSTHIALELPTTEPNVRVVLLMSRSAKPVPLSETR